MELKDVLNISGKPGLFKIIKTTPKNLIVESLLKKGKRMSISPTGKMASLGDISIYTLDDEIKLIEVFKTMKAQIEENPLPDPKANDSIIKAYFQKIVPNYDARRVYTNDISKIIKWFNQLNTLIDFSATKSADEEE